MLVDRDRIATVEMKILSGGSAIRQLEPRCPAGLCPSGPFRVILDLPGNLADRLAVRHSRRYKPAILTSSV